MRFQLPGVIEILYKKGAEAHLFKEEWYGRNILRKVRIPKSYRHPVLDKRLRMARTTHEAKILTEVRKLGISTPIIYYIDVPNAAILMEFIEGERVKELLNNPKTNHTEICKQIGTIIGILHKNNIIHGDLTTSNMIIQAESQKIYLIDFGLAEYSATIESRGVDLHLIHRALQSTHFQILDACFEAIKSGYSAIVGVKKAKEVKGPSYIHVLSVCPTGWRIPPEQAIKYGRLAVETGVFPLYEIENGEYKLTFRPQKKKPVTDYLKGQGRYRHLAEADFEKIQKEVDIRYKKLLKQCGEKLK